jgi:acetyltransferase-like isoleucine patch superfamily enzyme
MEKTNSVSFTVNRQIEIGAGVILSPGAYYGTSQQLGFPRVHDMTWTKPEYTLELGELELRSLGNQYLRSAKYNVTKFVDFGDITVAT